MRGSPRRRAQAAGLGSYDDGGIAEREKAKWVPVRKQNARAEHFSADDVRFMREMYEAGYAVPYIGRVFGFGDRDVYAICTGSLFKRVTNGQSHRAQAGETP